MSSPKLGRRLVLEQPTRMADGAGGFVSGWSALGVIWAAIDPGSLRISAQPAAGEARLPLRITVRGAPVGAPSRPQPGQRFRDGSRVYPISSVSLSDASGRYLLCVAYEEAAL
ncbi:head-tail adaptor protein [Rubellimicrobium rubrum]|uniref:Head-tail adaptor protein n=1 Tax=Rubellimicrobium rubrum TaxID=2585369 RepID=A0A5C4N956_9RHOB|nr:head-tail adaptor protein [Rubellimicrobium rubrum]TNC52802.1 head-tail adaptor protein [Rubellimicrobium rubrum]